jgi:hypothetical protein
MAILEAGDREDIPLEARNRRHSEVATAGQTEYQLLTSRYWLRLDRRRSLTVGCGAIEGERDGPFLGRRTEWV